MQETKLARLQSTKACPTWPAHLLVVVEGATFAPAAVAARTAQTPFSCVLKFVALQSSAYTKPPCVITVDATRSASANLNFIISPIYFDNIRRLTGFTRVSIAAVVAISKLELTCQGLPLFALRVRILA